MVDDSNGTAALELLPFALKTKRFSFRSLSLTRESTPFSSQEILSFPILLTTRLMQSSKWIKSFLTIFIALFGFQEAPRTK